MSDVEQFKAAMAGRGIIPPDKLIADGALHRCDVEGKRGKGDAAYILHLDGIAAGGFENWRDGLDWQNWRAEIGRPLTPDEEAAGRAAIQKARREREAENVKRKTEAREACDHAWSAAKPASHEHPYLVKKGVKSHGLRVTANGRLLVPVREGRTLHSLQFIDGDGTKRFKIGGRKQGCYFSIGKPDGVLCICEGYATGASIHESTGYAVAIAFDAGNLEAVAKALRAKLPDVRMVLCADDDWQTEGNPGLTKAREAAQTIGAAVAVPVFEGERQPADTDFNDMAAKQGADAVMAVIEAARDNHASLINVKVSGEVEAAANPSTEQLTSEGEGEADAPAKSDNVPLTLTDKRLAELASLSGVEYDRIREKEAKALNIRVGTLDKEVAKHRHEQSSAAGINFAEVELWNAPVRPDELLSDIAVTIKRFIICQDETANAAALWVAMTWFMDVVQIAPLAVITAPEKRCGKSQLLTLLGKLVYRPLASSNISPAAVFRAIDAWEPTLLVDEADAFMKDNEDMRNLLNGGHTRDQAYVIRVVGEDFTPTRFNIWGAKAISGIGSLADTLMDRAIILELRRKMPHENVERIRYAEPGLFDELASKLARFARDNKEAIRRARPYLPHALNDRAQDNWEPLFSIADVAGDEWAALARHAALTLSNSGEDSTSGHLEKPLFLRIC
ncbi:hypothetical protein AGMMS49545_16420 [Betaproteobacteria bacterium]|nr:hypothetical protein AGMMS49545_16420 [Betaproteobacteria bacterium]GHU46351.1 hypothetical protein AGMMS50289_19570 [Betaproteobacteria bacterium]